MTWGMGMVCHSRSPGVEHGGGADARTEVLGVGRDGDQGLGGGFEQQVIDDGLVLVGDRGDLGWQREDDTEIADRQQIGRAGREPILRRRPLTLGAVAIAARVVGDAAVAAIFAALDMPAERDRTALLDRRHDLELLQAHMSGIGPSPVGPMAMKDICNLQLRAVHRRRLGLGSLPLVDQGCELVERAGDGPDRRTGNAGVKCRGVELGVAERTRAIMRTFYVIETRGSAEQDLILAGGATLSARDTRPGPPS